jgi:hypothetical protein
MVEAEALVMTQVIVRLASANIDGCDLAGFGDGSSAWSGMGCFLRRALDVSSSKDIHARWLRMVET